MLKPKARGTRGRN
ncbi:hypothetical protein IEO21_03527 [Rhodonia placenta]|uniref:Uncharacterized protein n=1 Tax=Rhodonia placenta TaxID=104341 RepID=A0A8H7U462_9APHY|nr:hypothetical protein IEO21_11059 [Postia placenta]KAF9798026.1 hypothetical protein IEO21_10805 [Postia placenta]KAF9798358.1 hypothetical protein IEO21_10740 [Postia placenta]KAF9801913.1 hypothetical protein IEO21_10007 [Postia placenta]KAF9802635.1 hypothetical protein IEO21_09860 [Postia placenta]